MIEDTATLIIASLHQQGYTPHTIALRLGLNSNYVNEALKSPEIVAFLNDLEVSTDAKVKALYPDAIDRLVDALYSLDPKIYLKASEYILRLNSKLKPGEESKTPITIDKLLIMLNRAPEQHELAQAQKALEGEILDV